ncbi:MAG: hypothetical protein GAK43_02735 [Stenotrophomonas maltophilia]|nr:MAG: hypothetical protein GAK43_02735 [Stenotrophomonas maltophilia]
MNVSLSAGWRCIAAALALSLSTAALAGPGDHGGPGGPGPGWGPGPGHGHGLPGVAREVWIGSMLYFVAAGTYYLWNADRSQYIPVDAPPAVQASNGAPTGYDVIAYPARGQSPDMQARDRYECHGWAVNQSGFDPASATQAPPLNVADTYRRALSACLTGRGYSVN